MRGTVVGGDRGSAGTACKAVLCAPTRARTGILACRFALHYAIWSQQLASWTGWILSEAMQCDGQHD